MRRWGRTDWRDLVEQVRPIEDRGLHQLVLAVAADLVRGVNHLPGTNHGDDRNTAETRHRVPKSHCRGSGISGAETAMSLLTCWYV